MVDAYALIDKLSTFTLGGLVTLILIGSYFKIWVWGSVVLEMKADFERRIAEEREAKQRWQDAALAGAGLSELLKKVKTS